MNRIEPDEPFMYVIIVTQYDEIMEVKLIPDSFTACVVYTDVFVKWTECDELDTPDHDEIRRDMANTNTHHQFHPQHLDLAVVMKRVAVTTKELHQ